MLTDQKLISFALVFWVHLQNVSGGGEELLGNHTEAALKTAQPTQIMSLLEQNMTPAGKKYVEIIECHRV